MKKIFFFAAVACTMLSSCCPKSGTETLKDFTTLAQERYSCRSYTAEKVSDEDLKLILEAGRLAPTAANSQSQKIFVLKSEETVAKVSEIVSFCGAPQAFLICYDSEKCLYVEPNGNAPSGDVDAAIVFTHMMLKATEMGIGTCCMNWVEFGKIKEVLGLGDNIVPVLFMPFGYASEDATPSESHTSRKSLEETVTVL